MCQKIVVEEMETLILFSVTSSREFVVYEIMLKKYGTHRHAADDNTILRMRVAC